MQTKKKMDKTYLKLDMAWSELRFISCCKNRKKYVQNIHLVNKMKRNDFDLKKNHLNFRL